MSYCYTIYGLNINSSRQIKILPEKAFLSNIDLSITWTTDSLETPDPELNWERIITNGLKNSYRITFFRAKTTQGFFTKVRFDTEAGGLYFLLGPDKEKLWLVHNQEELQSNLDSYFVGTILGCILRLKGILCLHASVVEINEKAVIFLGRKKSGKSTTAAAFAKKGFRVLSDDLAAITIIDNRFYIESGYPKVRLRPKSLAVLHPEISTDFVSVFSHRDSRYTAIEDNFCKDRLQLGTIYILGETDKDDDIPFVEPVSAQRLIHLHENAFAGYIITPDLRKQEFDILSKLALHIPIRRLRFGRTVEMVNLQCQTVIEDLSAIEQTTNLP